jgi:hypothetical protein
VPSVCQQAHKAAELAGGFSDCGESIDNSKVSFLVQSFIAVLVRSKSVLRFRFCCFCSTLASRTICRTSSVFSFMML